MIDPAHVALYVPERLRGPKRWLLDEIGQRCGAVIAEPHALDGVHAAGLIPCVGCYPGVAGRVARWRREGLPWIYRDRGYLRRAPRAVSGMAPGTGEGFWRWHANACQMTRIEPRPADRLRRLHVAPRPWRTAGRGAPVLVAEPSDAYAAFHGIAGWTRRTVAALREATDRPVIVRSKPPPRDGSSPLSTALAGVHALVTHGSIAAVEAAVLGVPVFVDASSAAAPVGLTDLAEIDMPARPDRDAWLRALAWCQFDAAEMRAGLMWEYLDI